MRIYLQNDLVKAAKKKDAAGRDNPQVAKQGEQRGGNYAARIQVGYDKDGSPKYKYFKTLEDRNKYLQSKGDKKDSKKEDLKSKLKKEQAASKTKQDRGKGKVDNAGLFVKDKKKKEAKEKAEEKDDDKKKVSKAIPMFIWRFE